VFELNPCIAECVPVADDDNETKSSVKGLSEQLLASLNEF
jgi:hypothetical protein